jgi:hypothetical protein
MCVRHDENILRTTLSESRVFFPSRSYVTPRG